MLANLLLPAMDGGELAERARDLEPGLRVALMTSESERGESELLAGYHDVPVLEKPVAFGRLYDLLVERVGRRPGHRGPARRDRFCSAIARDSRNPARRGQASRISASGS